MENSSLKGLASSLETALTALPDQASAVPPKAGISLLDVKNELLLSYLQNLAFLILLKLRNASKAGVNTDSAEESTTSLNDDVVKKLVELRVYLEKGVRPLEGRLKYQIDKVIRAADNAARPIAPKVTNSTKKSAHAVDDNGSEEGSEEDNDTDAESAQASPAGAVIDELSYRPNPSSFARPAAGAKRETDATANDGIYKPPRITPTALPATRGREERAERRPAKSATLDEFVADELSTALIAEPSIGSTIISGGRRTKSQRERQEDAERQAYEETNFVRLPKESKKERAKKGYTRRDGEYGGEEWRGLGAGLDRIEKMTSRKGGRTGSASVLDKSRKRPIEDGPRGTGMEAGEAFKSRKRIRTRKR